MLVIRPERPDQPEITALLGALDRYLESLYPPEANHILDVQALLAPEVSFLVARRDGQAVGTAACRRMPGEPETGGQPYGEIKRMYVLPIERGQRIAERLLHALEDGLRSDGIGLALLETGCDQAEAVRLYERCGYSRRGSFGGYADNGLSLFLAKPL
jgi:putative acetyltransferase